MCKYESGLVSVVMPTYKRSEKLSRAIESVLNQSYEKIELLLVNDNEPEDEYTLELKKRVKQYSNDSRFRLIIQEKHINGAAARNVGILQAKGEYIAFLDDDDWWEINKIEKQVETLSKLDDTWGGVSCRIIQYDNDKIIGRMPKYKNGLVYKDILMLRSDYATGTILLRRKCLDISGYFNEKLLRHQDLQLLIDFTYKFKLYQIDEFLHCCDISDNSNRPDVDKAKNAKRALFESEKNIISTMSNYEIKTMLAMHRFEIAYIELKTGNKIRGLLHCFVVFSTPHALFYTLNKIIKKIISIG